jgi:hypothetical protein
MLRTNHPLLLLVQLAVVASFLLVESSIAFSVSPTTSTSPTTTTTTTARRPTTTSAVRLWNSPNSDDDDDGKKESLNPIAKASWYAVEVFGKVFGDSTTTTDVAVVSTSGAPRSLEETTQRIQLDNDRSYFLSGQVDEEIYDVNCIFSDPFVSFEGRDRFVDNLANLGSFITNYSAKVLDNRQVDETTVQTRVSDILYVCMYVSYV